MAARVATTESVEEPVAVSERRGGVQVDVLGIAEYQPAMDNADSELECGDEPVSDFV